MKKSEKALFIARQTIEIEQSALAKLSQSLENEGFNAMAFVDCVTLISKLKGRVVVCGIGKSAIVAQKIVATFNSTGTPSVFLHAADAIHGDLGIITKEDVTICLSKSGETPEIRVLAPLLKAAKVSLIAMTANPNSTLAKLADLVLITPVEKEADPNNLAPTTSTTVQIALGDALAVSLLSLRGFSPDDFAKFHPGGSLGKQLYLRVRDLYVLHESPKVAQMADLQEVIIEISSKRLGITAVTDEADKILGIVTDGDLRRLLQKGGDFKTVKAEDFMTKNPKTITPDALAVEALAQMREFSITQLIVAENGKYLGVVHLHDLVREGLI